MQSMINSITCSLVLLCSACASVERPDSVVYGVNAKASKLRGYNLKTDFDNNGNRKPDAKPIEREIASLMDLNGWTCTDPTGLARIKVYISDLISAYQNQKGFLNVSMAEKSPLETLQTPTATASGTDQSRAPAGGSAAPGFDGAEISKP